MVALSIGQLRNGGPGGGALSWSVLHLHGNPHDPNGFHKNLHSLLARLLNQNSFNRASTAQQLYQFFVDDLRAKFELVFNRSEFADRFKRVEIANLRRLRPSNRSVNSDHRYDRLVVHSVKRLESGLSSGDSVDQSDAGDLLADLTTITSSISSPGDLLERLSNYLPNSRLLIEFRVLFGSTDLDLELSASSVYLAISSELIKLNESLFADYNLDQGSLSVKEVYPEDRLDRTIQQLLRLVLNDSSILHSRRLKRLQLIKLNRLNRTTSNLDELDYLQIDNRTEGEGKSGIRCEERKLPFCQFLPYSSVMYPNLVNHRGLEELQSELIYFRQITDSECFHLAREFVCLLLHPACPSADDRPLLPCGQLCEQFVSSCSAYIPGQLRDRFYSCEQFGKLQDAIALFRDKNGPKDHRSDKGRSAHSGRGVSTDGDVRMDGGKPMRKIGGGRTDLSAASGQQIGKTMESNLMVGRDNESGDKDANQSADNNANDGKQIVPISSADELSDLHSALDESGGESNRRLVVGPGRAATVRTTEERRRSTGSESVETDEVKATGTTEVRPQARARRQSPGERRIESDDKNNLPDSDGSRDTKDDKMPNAPQLGNNCFSLEDLTQLTLSARVLN